MKGDEVNNFCLHSKAIWSILWASSGGSLRLSYSERRKKNVSVFVYVCVWERSNTIWIFLAWSLFLNVLVRALISSRPELHLNSVSCIPQLLFSSVLNCLSVPLKGVTCNLQISTSPLTKRLPYSHLYSIGLKATHSVPVWVKVRRGWGVPLPGL